MEIRNWNEIHVYAAVTLSVVEGQKTKINISNLPSGIYYLTLQTSEGSVTKKLVKE